MAESTMTERERAPNVCNACLRRKKTCDKALPSCGFCANRNLPCRYDIVARSHRGLRHHHPSRNFVALRTSPDPDVVAQARLPTGRVTGPLPFCLASESIDESIDQQVRSIIKLVNPLHDDDIKTRYFQRQWLPAVSPEYLHVVESRRLADGRTPPADVSVLVLAMWLIITLPDLDVRPASVGLSRESIFTTFKLLFSQTQAIRCSSIPLVQAAFIMATCEYTMTRPKTAYISIGTCVSLARVLDDGDDDDDEGQISYRGDIGSLLSVTERENLKWSISMLERYETNSKCCKITTEPRH
jgi:hypothetical protein